MPETNTVKLLVSPVSFYLVRLPDADACPDKTIVGIVSGVKHDVIMRTGWSPDLWDQVKHSTWWNTPTAMLVRGEKLENGTVEVTFYAACAERVLGDAITSAEVEVESDDDPETWKQIAEERKEKRPPLVRIGIVRRKAEWCHHDSLMEESACVVKHVVTCDAHESHKNGPLVPR